MFNDTGVMTFRAAGTVYKYRRVKFSGTNDFPSVALAGATGVDCGVATKDAATGDMIGVQLLNKEGSLPVQLGAATAPAFGATLYPAADGKLTNSASTANAIPTYTAVRTASATNEVLEVIFKQFHSTNSTY